jgi:hypothetical protein
MELHQPKEALEAYQKALAAAPGRRNSMRGAEEASKLAGSQGDGAKPGI